MYFSYDYETDISGTPVIYYLVTDILNIQSAIFDSVNEDTVQLSYSGSAPTNYDFYFGHDTGPLADINPGGPLQVVSAVGTFSPLHITNQYPTLMNYLATQIPKPAQMWMFSRYSYTGDSEEYKYVQRNPSLSISTKKMMMTPPDTIGYGGLISGNPMVQDNVPVFGKNSYLTFEVTTD
jgi:hypothetical protein